MKKNNSNHKTSMVFNKTHGQHILINHQIIKQIVQKSAIRPTDVVLQIGPGTGNLTNLLLQNGKKVIAIQLDPRMVSQLTKRFKYGEYGKKLQIIPGDVLQTKIPFFDICVANIPYQISSPLIFKLLSQKQSFRCAVLMLQKQFGLRLVAKPGSQIYCRLSVNVQLLARVDHLLKVSKNNFKPPPKVESCVIRIQPRNPPPPINFIQWDSLLRICFTRKNKQLGSIFKNKKILKMLQKNHQLIKKQQMKQNLILEEQQDQNASQEEQQQIVQQGQLLTFKNKVINVLKQNNLETQRPSKMEIDQFLKLLASFNQQKIHFR